MSTINVIKSILNENSTINEASGAEWTIDADIFLNDLMPKFTKLMKVVKSGMPALAKLSDDWERDSEDYITMDIKGNVSLKVDAFNVETNKSTTLTQVIK